jgi:alpha-N-arabinofuranosidase
MAWGLFELAGAVFAAVAGAAGASRGAPPAFPALPPVPAAIVANVPEAADYSLVYQLPIDNATFRPEQYVVDRSKSVPDGSFGRVAYYLELESAAFGKQWVWVSMDAFTDKAGLLGVPKTEEHTQQKPVTHLNVASNVAGIVNGDDLEGNIEFWTMNYGGQPSHVVPGGTGTHDFDDTHAPGNYGSMQVHNYVAKQTLFAYNHWNDTATSDLGIGNQPKGNPDWTFSAPIHADGYTVKNLYVLVSARGAVKTGGQLKYLYGQCIGNLDSRTGGGIWAEMLEDRKFFHPVGQAGSPWQIAGSGATVTMDTARPLAGKHSPRIALSGGGPGGISQAGLVLEAGRSYVGRLWLAGDSSAGPVEARLVWAYGQDGCQVVAVPSLAKAFEQTPLRFTAGGSTVDGRLEIRSSGAGSFRVGAVSLMPEDAVEGFRKDAMHWLGVLYTPIYRWPGGDFLKGYVWKDGLGDRDRRPPRLLDSGQVDQNDVGVDEFLAFCRLLRAEPCVAVAGRPGDGKAAVELVQYCNGAAATAAGKLRVANGRPTPYGVKRWEIGTALVDPAEAEKTVPKKYVEALKACIAVMAAVDPKIEVLAVAPVGDVAEAVSQAPPPRLAALAESLYAEPQGTFEDHVRQLAEALQTKADAVKEYRQRSAQMAAQNVRLAVDEWNYALGPGDWKDLEKHDFLQDAFGVALGLHALVRRRNVVALACYAQTDRSVGALWTSKSGAAPTPAGLVLKLYRQRFGCSPVKIDSPPPLDAVAAFNADGTQLTVAVVNPSSEPHSLPVAVGGAKLAGAGKQWRIAGRNPKAVNKPGEPLQVTIESSPISDFRGKLWLPAQSITVVALDVVPPEQ